MELIIASRNSHKVLEMREALQELFPLFEIRSLYDFSTVPFLDVQCSSLEENAIEKAKRATQLLQKPCIAEDSALIIPALGGIKGLFLKKYEASQGVVISRCNEIIEQMATFSDDQRMAYFESAVAFALPSGEVFVHVARCEGRIAEMTLRSVGNDFESIFIKHDYLKPLSELPQAIRSKISVRRKAIEGMRLAIQKSMTQVVL